MDNKTVQPVVVPVKALQQALLLSRAESYRLARKLDHITVGKALRVRVTSIREMFGDDIAQSACQHALS